MLMQIIKFKHSLKKCIIDKLDLKESRAVSGLQLIRFFFLLHLKKTNHGF